jgi:hypothetical protein
MSSFRPALPTMAQAMPRFSRLLGLPQTRTATALARQEQDIDWADGPPPTVLLLMETPFEIQYRVRRFFNCPRVAGPERLATGVCPTDDSRDIDLRIGPDGEVTCFEVNPSPGYSYYEANTGQPIASSLARYLMYES